MEGQNENVEDFQFGGEDVDFEEKMNEIKVIQNKRTAILQDKLNEKEFALLTITRNMEKLQDDFNFNLEVIKQQEGDIQDMTTNIIALRDIIDTKDVDIKELNDNMQKLKKNHQVELSAMNDKMKTLMERLEDLKGETRLYRTGQMDEVRKTKLEYEDKIRELKATLQRQEHEANNKEQQLLKQLQRIQETNAIEKSSSDGLLNQISRDKKDLTEKINALIEASNVEKLRLVEELNEKKRQLIERDNKFTEITSDFAAKITQLTHERDSFKREAEREHNLVSDIEKGSKNQLETLLKDNSDLKAKLLKKKSKYKKKVLELQHELTSRTETWEREKTDMRTNYETKLRDLEKQLDAVSFSEKNALEKLKEVQFKGGREIQNAHERVSVAEKKFENELKRLKNDLDMKDIEIRHYHEEKAQYLNEFRVLKETIKNLNENENTLKNENKILIQEVVQYRKEHPEVVNLLVGQQILHSKEDAESLEKSPPAQKTEKMARMEKDKGDRDHLHPQQKGHQPAQPMIKVQEEQGEESFDKMFSEDMGPASMYISRSPHQPNITSSRGQNLSIPQRNNLLRTSNDQTTKNVRIIEMEKEIAEYKRVINQMVQESSEMSHQSKISAQINRDLNARINILEDTLKSTREFLDQYKREKEELEIRMKQLEVQKTMALNDRSIYENEIKKLKDELSDVEKTIHDLKKQKNMLVNENKQLKNDREQLEKISEELRSDKTKLEDLVLKYQDLEPQEPNRKMWEMQILNLETHIAHLEEQLKALAIETEEKDLPKSSEILASQPGGGRKRSPNSGHKKASDQQRSSEWNRPSPPQIKFLQNIPNYNNFVDVMNIKPDRDQQRGGGQDEQLNDLVVVSHNKPLNVRASREEERPRPSTATYKQKPQIKKPVKETKEPEKQGGRATFVRNWNLKDDTNFAPHLE